MNADSKLPQILKAREAAEFLRLGSVNAIYRHIRENRLPYLRVGGHYRFDIDELKAWMKGYGSALEQTRAMRKVG
jgi:excisionase family DNA binding protein